ncbi:MAG: hypothetical protein WAO15_10230 [Mycobacterium sp.]
MLNGFGSALAGAAPPTQVLRAIATLTNILVITFTRTAVGAPTAWATTAAPAGGGLAVINDIRVSRRRIGGGHF